MHFFCARVKGQWKIGSRGAAGHAKIARPAIRATEPGGLRELERVGASRKAVVRPLRALETAHRCATELRETPTKAHVKGGNLRPRSGLRTRRGLEMLEEAS
jgi:hypothetical protein